MISEVSISGVIYFAPRQSAITITIIITTTTTTTITITITAIINIMIILIMMIIPPDQAQRGDHREPGGHHPAAGRLHRVHRRPP